MRKLDRSFIYKRFKQTLIEKYGNDKTIAIWNDADTKLRSLLNEYRDIGSDEKMMVLPLHALYVTLKQYEVENALELLEEYGVQVGNNLSTVIYKVTSVPGVSEILWNNMPKLMRKTSSPEKGYERRIVSETKELVGVDILVCPLYEMAKRLGTPEITSIVCLIDKGQMVGFKHIIYTRTKALGNGEFFCDYRLRFDKSKK